MIQPMNLQQNSMLKVGNTNPTKKLRSLRGYVYFSTYFRVVLGEFIPLKGIT